MFLMREDATWARLVMVTSALKGLAIKIMGNVGNYTIVHWKRWKPWNLVTAFLSAKIQKKILIQKFKENLSLHYLKFQKHW